DLQPLASKLRELGRERGGDARLELGIERPCQRHVKSELAEDEGITPADQELVLRRAEAAKSAPADLGLGQGRAEALKPHHALRCKAVEGLRWIRGTQGQERAQRSQFQRWNRYRHPPPGELGSGIDEVAFAPSLEQA